MGDELAVWITWDELAWDRLDVFWGLCECVMYLRAGHAHHVNPELPVLEWNKAEMRETKRRRLNQSEYERNNNDYEMIMNISFFTSIPFGPIGPIVPGSPTGPVRPYKQTYKEAHDSVSALLRLCRKCSCVSVGAWGHTEYSQDDQVIHSDQRLPVRNKQVFRRSMTHHVCLHKTTLRSP